MMLYYVKECDWCGGAGLDPLNVDDICPDCRGYDLNVYPFDLSNPFDRIIAAEGLADGTTYRTLRDAREAVMMA